MPASVAHASLTLIIECNPAAFMAYPRFHGSFKAGRGWSGLVGVFFPAWDRIMRFSSVTVMLLATLKPDEWCAPSSPPKRRP